jgi:hypothetical protein
LIVTRSTAFHIGAGACNFTWAEDRDLFMNGPLTFRFTDTEPTQDIYMEVLTIRWEKYLVRHHGVEINGRHESLLQEYRKEHKIKSGSGWNIVLNTAIVTIPVVIGILLYRILINH